METNVRTPLDIFNLPQSLVVPLFQRPYVWDESEQWLPLWQDVRRLAEHRLAQPYSPATHFLGAVVVQAQENQMGSLPARNVIDGQQRLTTLQLLMDAAGSILDEAGLEALSGQLEVLTHNLQLYVSGGGTRLKLRHTNRDQTAFDEVMSAEPPLDYASLAHSGSLLARAHQFFAESVRGWLEEPGDDPGFNQRGEVLVNVLTRGLQLVVIDLQAQENSQEIFETLNARGTPLTAADLVKNFVFQRLDAEGVDTRHAYANDWPFESKFWETEVSVGRYLISRSSLFINQWLVARLGEEIGPKSTFTRFKHYVDHECDQKMSDLLVLIKRQADAYENWTVAAADSDRALSPTEMSVYRMQASGVELLKPALIWLHDPELAIPSNVADEVIAATESWVIRRQMLRLQSADLGRIVADLIHVNRTAPATELPERVRGYLTRLSSVSTYWPGDEEIRAALTIEPVYRRFPRSRLRMFLEAVEDRLRSKYNYPPVPRRGYPIEHVLPQKWEEHWPAEGLEKQLDRAAHVHRLGNLTLLTEGLNSAVSNGSWTSKREKVAQNDTFLMNRLFRDPMTDAWEEQQIDDRTSSMLEALLATWPVPEGHAGEVRQSETSQPTWVEVKHLVAADLLPVGTRLQPRAGKWGAADATVRADGAIELDGQTFHTPSGAGRHVRGRATNGWTFWRLEDGRKLSDVRALFRGDQPATDRRAAAFDWAGLHAIVEALPEGRWTTYGDLADAVGTAAQAVGNHITACSQCVNAHRVLRHTGRVADAFNWADPEDRRDPKEMLRAEGVRFTGDRADATQRLAGDDLAALVAKT
ncbi:MAG: GmrSD restriction endonuclease domain-containing protein [Actinomycetota bacterium]